MKFKMGSRKLVLIGIFVLGLFFIFTYYINIRLAFKEAICNSNGKCVWAFSGLRQNDKLIPGSPDFQSECKTAQKYYLYTESLKLFGLYHVCDPNAPKLGGG